MNCDSIFRRMESVNIKTANGESISAYGTVAALKTESGEFGGKRHELGNLSRPLCKFWGRVPKQTELVGGTLTASGGEYNIIDSREIFLGKHDLGVRLLLESRGKGEG